MASFSENFRGPHGSKMCSLDNQQMSFNCPVLKPKLDEKGKYEIIFGSKKHTRAEIKGMRVGFWYKELCELP